MLLVLFLRPRVYQHIIDEDNYKFIQKLPEHSVHQIHESCRGICQTKRHHQELVMPVPTAECCLGYILLSDSQLVKLDLKLILENTEAPLSWSNKSSILSKGYLFLMVTLLSNL